MTTSNGQPVQEIGVEMHGVRLNLRCDYPKLPDPSSVHDETAYVTHVAEGVIPEARNEFLNADTGWYARLFKAARRVAEPGAISGHNAPIGHQFRRLTQHAIEACS